MPTQLTDEEIAVLINEPKPLPSNFRARLRTRPKRGHSEQDLDVTGENGGQFRLILRQSLLNTLDFSVILGVRPSDTSQIFRLRRYNGKSHEHTNALEAETFYDFHIHLATERYQELGIREDSYAVPTDRYADFEGALTSMIADCGFVLPVDPQTSLF